MRERIPEGSAPGEYIRAELEARSLTQVEFAKILGRPVQFVSELLSGKRSVTPQTAVALASAFGIVTVICVVVIVAAGAVN